MRENGRHGRELEEHFCFLALPQSDVVEIYQNGLSTRASTLKTLGNPLLGIYMFRHVDVALNYAHSQSTTVENIVIFKVGSSIKQIINIGAFYFKSSWT